MTIKFDKINKWSEVKLDIIQAYAIPYMKIMRNNKFNACYIDGFSGAGEHIRKNSGVRVAGSPSRVMSIPQPFDTYHFVDLDGDKTKYLREICRKNFPHINAVIETGDCNDVLLRILPKYSWGKLDRLFCLLDPYGLHLNWNVIEKMGHMGIVDLILHFPIMDINRNAIWHNPDRVSANGIQRMNSFWGDSTWRDIAYRESLQKDMFGSPIQEKQNNNVLITAFQKRLKNKGQFEFVPKPMPLKNKTNAAIYYLFFASQNKIANKIATYLFTKYSNEHGFF